MNIEFHEPVLSHEDLNTLMKIGISSDTDDPQFESIEEIIEERKMMWDKLMKLEKFLHSESIRMISRAEQRRMKRQYHHMNMYFAMLNERVRYYDL